MSIPPGIPGREYGNYCRRLCGRQEPGCAIHDCMCTLEGMSAHVRDAMPREKWNALQAGYEAHRQMCQNNYCVLMFNVTTCAAGARCADASGKGHVPPVCARLQPAHWLLVRLRGCGVGVCACVRGWLQACGGRPAVGDAGRLKRPRMRVAPPLPLLQRPALRMLGG